jgi:hypothetical protein
MHWCHREPTLKDMLADSIVRAVMEADGVDPHELEAMLTQMGRRPSLDVQRLGPLLLVPSPLAGEGRSVFPQT